MSVPAFLPKMFAELHRWRQCARYLYYREIEGRKYGVVLATMTPNDRPALNKSELERAPAGKRKGTIDEAYVVVARLNGIGYEFLGASDAETIAKRLEGRSTISGKFGDFWTLDIFEIDDNTPL